MINTPTIHITETIMSESDGLFLIIIRYANGSSIIYAAISSEDLDVVVYCSPTVKVKTQEIRILPL